MRPTKLRDLLPEIAEETRFPLGLVEAVNQYYWSEVRKELSSIQNLRVHLDSLGDFTVKHWNLERELLGAERKLDAYQNKARPVKQVIEDTQHKIKALNELIKQHASEEQRKEFIKNHKRKQYEEDLAEAM